MLLFATKCDGHASPNIRVSVNANLIELFQEASARLGKRFSRLHNVGYPTVGSKFVLALAEGTATRWWSRPSAP
jgi:hypothetical protein